MEEKTKKPKLIKTRFLVAFGALIVFMIGSVFLLRVPGNQSSSDIDKNTNVDLNSSENISESIPDDVPEDIPAETVPQSDSENLSIADIDISGLGPVETYLAIRKEMVKIKNSSDAIYFVQKYGSQKNVSSISVFQEVQKALDEFDLLSLIFSYVPKEIKFTEFVSKSTNESVFKIMSDDGQEGEVKMVLENNLWKLDYENWEK